MGDRYDRKHRGDRSRLPHLRGKPPPEILAWGLAKPVGIGHNNGPPLDEEPGYLWRRYRWTKAHAEAWKTPSMSILKFRVARAEAAGVPYERYVCELLDSGRHLQRGDVATRATVTPMNQTRTMSQVRIERAFDDVIARCAPPSLFAQRHAVRSRLVAAYGASDRHYHGLDHIAALLDAFDANRAMTREFDAVALAILWHDAIYDPKRSDNEAVSAALAAADLGALGVGASLIARVEDLIMATRHAASGDTSDLDKTLLVDLDLGILAASEAVYDSYAAAIRREYAHVPAADYRRGRAAVLQGFLERPAIFGTPSLAALWETAARRNLAREHATLATLTT